MHYKLCSYCIPHSEISKMGEELFLLVIELLYKDTDR